jgi:hypothetical protein
MQWLLKLSQVQLLAGCLLFSCMGAAAQPVELKINDSGVYSYQEVIQIDGTPDELFDRISAWLALSYRSSNDVVQLTDRPNHLIIAKGAFEETNFGQPVLLKHTLQAEARENRVRISYSQFVYQAGDSEFLFEKRVPRGGRMREKTSLHIRAAIDSLKAFLSASVTDEDWD